MVRKSACLLAWRDPQFT